MHALIGAILGLVLNAFTERYALPAVLVLHTLWVRLYTHGLPPEEREERLARVLGDLDAQREGRRAEGYSPRSIVLEMLLQLPRSMPADIGWRHDAATRDPLWRLRLAGWGDLLGYVGALLGGLSVTFDTARAVGWSDPSVILMGVLFLLTVPLIVVVETSKRRTHALYRRLLDERSSDTDTATD